jgi:hypothetical protein
MRLKALDDGRRSRNRLPQRASASPSAFANLFSYSQQVWTTVPMASLAPVVRDARAKGAQLARGRSDLYLRPRRHGLDVYFAGRPGPPGATLAVQLADGVGRHIQLAYFVGSEWRRCPDALFIGRRGPVYPRNAIDPEPMVVRRRLYVFFGGVRRPSQGGNMRGSIVLRAYALQ